MKLPTSLISPKYRSFFKESGVAFKHPILANEVTAQTMVSLMRKHDLHNKVVIQFAAGVGAIPAALLTSDRCPKSIHMFEQDKSLRAVIEKHLLNPPLAPVSDTKLHLHELGQLQLPYEDYGFWTSCIPEVGNANSPPVTAITSFPPNQASSHFYLFLKWAAEQSAFYQFGRVPLYAFVPFRISDRLLAQPGNPLRCRVSVYSQLIFDTEVIETPDEVTFVKCKIPLSLVRLQPKLEPLVHPKKYAEVDYLLKTLFVAPAVKLSKSLGYIDPTKTSIASMLPESILNKSVRDITREQLLELCDAFNRWPLKREFHGDQLTSGPLYL